VRLWRRQFCLFHGQYRLLLSQGAQRQCPALNGGLGNLGVSAMQFLVPVVITGGVFGALGGEPQRAGTGAHLWLQNAGFVWVPFIIASSLLSWFGMNDIADAKASFAEQAIIFQRKHNWLMCWLYTGTFGSFIGFSASLPLLAKKEFPAVEALKYVWIAPLVGAISRAATGWVADRWGGARHIVGLCGDDRGNLRGDAFPSGQGL
jgi:NNP family nitrate/nitrite transporter-like MFS transporter